MKIQNFIICILLLKSTNFFSLETNYGDTIFKSKNTFYISEKSSNFVEAVISEGDVINLKYKSFSNNVVYVSEKISLIKKDTIIIGNIQIPTIDILEVSKYSQKKVILSGLGLGLGGFLIYKGIKNIEKNKLIEESGGFSYKLNLEPINGGFIVFLGSIVSSISLINMSLPKKYKTEKYYFKTYIN